MNMSIEESKQRNKGREKYVLKGKITSQDTLDRCKNPYRQPRTLRKSKGKLISTRSNDSLAVDAEAKIENANVELSFQDKCKKNQTAVEEVAYTHRGPEILFRCIYGR